MAQGPVLLVPRLCWQRLTFRCVSCLPPPPFIYAGLVRITGLLRLQRLELFGEELRLDPELLASLARLPALAHLSMAGLDALHVPLMSDLPQQRGPGSSGHCAQPHNRDAACTRFAPRCAGMAGDGACTCGGDLEDMEASSSSAGDVHDVADDDDESSSSMSMEDVTSRHVVACMSPRGGAGGEEEGKGGPRMNMPLHPSIPRPCYSVREVRAGQHKFRCTCSACDTPWLYTAPQVVCVL